MLHHVLPLFNEREEEEIRFFLVYLALHADSLLGMTPEMAETFVDRYLPLTARG